MSGGRYNELFNIHDRHLQHLADQFTDLQAMAIRLAELDAGDAAAETFQVLADLATVERNTATRVARLREVWQAVEWLDSGDGHPDQIREALEAYRTAGTAECPDCFALVPAGRVKAHEYWHDRQLEQWRRDHLGEA